MEVRAFVKVFVEFFHFLPFPGQFSPGLAILPHETNKQTNKKKTTKQTKNPKHFGPLETSLLFVINGLF